MAAALSVAVVTELAHAAGYATTPTVTWLASAVPTASSVDLARVVATDSPGRRTWAATGPCAVKSNALTTRKATGTCRLELRIAPTARFAAIVVTSNVQIRKRVELNVHVAASLTRVVTDLGAAFSARFLNVSMKFNFAGSSTLATQIQNGAPADVVAMADDTSMDKLVASGDVKRADVATLAYNELAILVPRGNPAKIGSLSDLTRSGLRVVMCDVAQPCGKYAATALSKAGVSLNPASREASASGVVSRVATGEADAGIAYVTDGLVSGDKVDPVRIPAEANVQATYPLARVADPSSGDAALVATFVAFARGPVGDDLLRRAGFIVP